MQKIRAFKMKPTHSGSVLYLKGRIPIKYFMVLLLALTLVRCSQGDTLYKQDLKN